MDFFEQYKQKLTTPEKAVEGVFSGCSLDLGYGAVTPVALDRALTARLPQLKDVIMYGGILTHKPLCFDLPDAADHFIWNSWHTSQLERHSISRGFVYYVPQRYSEVPVYLRDSIRHLDFVFLMVPPMDSEGRFNLSTSCSHLRAAADIADRIIVEVNRNVPVCLGHPENYVHIDEVDAIVEFDSHMDVFPTPVPTETDLAIARQIVAEIGDGACLQLGIGGLPAAVGSMIVDSDLKDLGIHSEMYCDSFVDMTEAGKITGARKGIDKGLQTFTFTAGTQRLYDFIDNNPICKSAPSNYINDARVIAQNDNVIAVNSAIDVDLFGQVCSETVGTTHISGSGGQQDFVLGAYLSKGGKSFICLPSTFVDKASGEKTSRIRATLREGSVITCTRTNVQYIVTEHGMFNCKGRTTWERAEGLIGIAAPEFREGLIKEAEAMHIWRRSNKR